MLLKAGVNVEGKSKLDWDVLDNGGETAFDYAVQHKNVAALEILLRAGVNVEGISKLDIERSGPVGKKYLTLCCGARQRRSPGEAS